MSPSAATVIGDINRGRVPLSSAALRWSALDEWTRERPLHPPCGPLTMGAAIEFDGPVAIPQRELEAKQLLLRPPLEERLRRINHTLPPPLDRCSACGAPGRSFLCRPCRRERNKGRAIGRADPLPNWERRIYLAVPKGRGRSARAAGMRFDRARRLWFAAWGTYVGILPWPVIVPVGCQPSRATTRLLAAHAHRGLV